MEKHCHLVGICHHCSWVPVSNVPFSQMVQKIPLKHNDNFQMFLQSARYP